MVSINYATREVACKIVYYGPGLSGKTTNLLYVHKKVPQNSRGKMISLATEADRTLYFDFLPINIGTINGFAAKFQLYTVPGQVYYNATRKLVLRGVDGLVFVADSQPDKMDENIESLTNLSENLAEYGYNIDELPVVIQYNKRDLPGALSVDELNARLNPKGWHTFEASAVTGEGVFDTLKLIIKLVLEKAKGGNKAAKPAPVSVAAEARQPAASGQSQTDAVGTSSSDRVVPPRQEAALPRSEMTPVREQAYRPDETRETEVPRPPDSSMFEHNVIKDESALDYKIGSGPAQETGPIKQKHPDIEETQVPESVHRPFPGSVGKASRPERRITVSDFQPDAADSEPAVADVPDDGSRQQESSMSAPMMAPSERVIRKKRGFFKKLFGIK
jgi:signal recognition particle receptor subunit beta